MMRRGTPRPDGTGFTPGPRRPRARLSLSSQGGTPLIAQRGVGLLDDGGHPASDKPRSSTVVLRCRETFGQHSRVLTHSPLPCPLPPIHNAVEGGVACAHYGVAAVEREVLPLAAEGERLADPHAIGFVLLLECRLRDDAAHGKEWLDARPRPFKGRVVWVCVARESRVRRWIRPGLAVGRALRVQIPKGAHRRAQILIGLRRSVGDDAWKLRNVSQLELESRAAREERPQSVEVLLGDLRRRQPRVEKREREGNVLRNPLRVEVTMCAGQRRVDVLEDERDRSF
jgi:hypothetical protein